MSEQRKQSFSSVIQSGNRLDSLIALRDRLARAIERCSARDLSPLSRQLTALLAEIEKLQAPEKEGSKLDDIAAARAKRRAAVGVPDTPAAERSASS
ncbi:hypothetical protein [Nocardia sp. NPDC046763]|uniref:hypothetical protein n=1 Tax=Nocardia sp. NPDC046763 TaxID=3155256 RepID=UPI0033FBA19E